MVLYGGGGVLVWNKFQWLLVAVPPVAKAWRGAIPDLYPSYPPKSIPVLYTILLSHLKNHFALDSFEYRSNISELSSV